LIRVIRAITTNRDAGGTVKTHIFLHSTKFFFGVIRLFNQLLPGALARGVARKKTVAQKFLRWPRLRLANAARPIAVAIAKAPARVFA
jgi:hypothetical protein